jgi:DNA-binding transcriptional LysR family regulator
MRLDPRRLIVLAAVDRNEGVVAAAAALRLSPSAVSQQLMLLERETGLALIDRSRRGGQRPIELTSLGHRLARHADRLVRVLEDAEADLTAVVDEATGPVTIGAFFTAIRSFVGPALTTLAISHPALVPRVLELDEAIPEVRAGTADIAVVEDDSDRRRLAPRGLRYEALLDDPFRVVIPAAWVGANDLADVGDRAWVDAPPGSAVAQTLRRMRRTTGLSFPPAHSCLEFTAALALVAAGLAGAFISELALRVAPLPPTVRVLSPPGLGGRRLGVLYRAGQHEPTPAVAAVLSALRSAAAADQPSLRAVDRPPHAQVRNRVHRVSE